MIPYHGTPVGGSRQDVARFLIGRNALVPFAYQDDMGIVAEVCKAFILDNSAWTAWTQNKPVDFAGYIRWVLQWYRHPGFQWALIPDVIDGAEADNDVLISEWPPELRDVGVPVWHLHESIDRLVGLAHTWRVVALGSAGQLWAVGDTRCVGLVGAHA